MLALVKRLKGGPWLWAAQHILRLGRRHWAALPDEDRKELRRLVRKSRGQTKNLTADERTQARAIVRTFIKNAEKR